MGLWFLDRRLGRRFETQATLAKLKDSCREYRANLDCLRRTKGVSRSLRGAEEHVKGWGPSHLAVG